MIDFSVIIGGITFPSKGKNGKILVFSSNDKNNTDLNDANIDLLPNSIQNCNAFDSHLSERDVIQSSSLWSFSLSHVLTIKDEDQLKKIFTNIGADLSTPRIVSESIFAGDDQFLAPTGTEPRFYHIGTEVVYVSNVETEGDHVICSNVLRGEWHTQKKHHGSLGSYHMPLTTVPIFWVGRDVYVYIDKKLFRKGVLAENPRVTNSEIAFSVTFSDNLLNSDLLGTRQDNIARLDDEHRFTHSTKEPYIIKKLASNPIIVQYSEKFGGFTPINSYTSYVMQSEILTQPLPKDYETGQGIFSSDRQQWWTGFSEAGNFIASFHFWFNTGFGGVTWDDVFSESPFVTQASVLQGFTLFWPSPTISLEGADVNGPITLNKTNILALINNYGERSELAGPNYRDVVLRYDDSNGFSFASTFFPEADPWIEIGIITQENKPYTDSTPLLGGTSWRHSLANDQSLIEESKSIISDIPDNWRQSNGFLQSTLNIPDTQNYLQPFQGGVGTLSSETLAGEGAVWTKNGTLYSTHITQPESWSFTDVYPWRLLSVTEQIDRKWYNSGYIGSQEFGDDNTTESIHWFKFPTIRRVTGTYPNYQQDGLESSVDFRIPLVLADKWVSDFDFCFLSQDLDSLITQESDLKIRWQELMNGGEFEDFEQKIHVIKDDPGFFKIRKNAARHAFNYKSFGEWTSQGGQPVSLIPILSTVNTLNNDNLNEVLCSVDGSQSNVFDMMVQGFGLNPDLIDSDSFNSFDSDWLKNYDLDKLRQEGFASLEGLLHLSSLCIRSTSQNGYKLHLASLATPTYNQVKCEFNDDNILTFPTNVSQLPVVSKYSVIGIRNNNEINISIVDGLALACMGTGEELSLDLTLGELSNNIQDNDFLKSKLFACHQRYGEPHNTISFSVALDADPYFLHLSCGDVIYLNSEILQEKLNLPPCLGQVTSVKIDLLKKQAMVSVFLWSQTVTGWNPSFKFTQSGTRVELTGADRVWNFLPDSVTVGAIYASGTSTDTYTKTNERGVYTSNNSRNTTGYVIFPDQTGFFAFNDIIV